MIMVPRSGKPSRVALFPIELWNFSYLALNTVSLSWLIELRLSRSQSRDINFGSNCIQQAHLHHSWTELHH